MTDMEPPTGVGIPATDMAPPEQADTSIDGVVREHLAMCERWIETLSNEQTRIGETLTEALTDHRKLIRLVAVLDQCNRTQTDTELST